MPVTADLSSPLTTPLALQITSKDCAEQTATELETVNDLDLNVNMLLDNVHEAPDQCVKGRLKENVEFWKHIGASRWVLTVIHDGYALPFVELPQRHMSKNNMSAIRNAIFVDSEIEKLLSSGCVKQVSSDQVHVISPLSVASNNGKDRLILDLRYINSCLRV
jgi:hypothetical protein